MKVTFKNHPKETGLRSVGTRTGADVKVGGKRCGTILGSNWGVGHRVQIALKLDSGWTWRMPPHEDRDLKRMKEWVKNNFTEIVGQHELHFFED